MRIVADVLIHCYTNSFVVLSYVNECLVACCIHQIIDISIDCLVVVPFKFRDQILSKSLNSFIVDATSSWKSTCEFIRE